MENIHLKIIFDFYNIFALNNIDCEAVLKSTQILCFVAKINVNPCKPHFHYIKVRYKGVYIAWAA